MTDDQARRVAQLNSRRSAGGAAGTVTRKSHRASKSRALTLGLSVAAVSGMVSGMWAQAAVANAEPAIAPSASSTSANSTQATNTALQPVVVPGSNGQPDHIVYLVVTRPSSSSGSSSLGSSATTPTPTKQVPSQAVTPTPITRTPIPVTRSHGSR